MSVSSSGSIELPAVMDIEASGFGAGSYPIEIGYVLADGRSDCMIIRREPDWVHWDPEAEALHGISREVLDQHGRSPIEVVRQLNRDLEGLTLYSDAWGNDWSWLSRLYDSVDAVPSFRLDALLVLMSEAQQELWHETKNRVMQDVALRRHRASNDARILQETYRRTALEDSPLGTLKTV